MSNKSQWTKIDPRCVGFSILDIKWSGETEKKFSEFGIGILQPYVNHCVARALFGFHRVYYKPSDEYPSGLIEVYFCLFWLVREEWEKLFSFKWQGGQDE